MDIINTVQLLTEFTSGTFLEENFSMVVTLKTFNSWLDTIGFLNVYLHVNVSDEGWLFTDPLLISNNQVTDWINQNFPNATDAIKQKIEAYYPRPFEALSRYDTEFHRVENIIAGLFPFLFRNV